MPSDAVPAEVPLAKPGSCLVAVNPGLLLVRNLQRFLDLPIVFRPFGAPPRDAAALIGWGLKGVALRAKAAAGRYRLPYCALEDGFLRSIAPGKEEGPLSLCVDDVGIYYDAHAPSRLETAIATPKAADQRRRAEALAAAWRNARVSKYNHAREIAPPIEGPFTLVVDQTFGDESISYGMASAASFARMLEAALDEHPDLPVLLKTHPDVIAGRKRAHFDALTPGQAARVTLLAANAHPPALLETAAAVYVVTSQMGFEALIHGRPVRCFGMPFYAGWGFTQDELPAPARRRTQHVVPLADLVHAALVDYVRCIDPETKLRCEPERLIEWMGLQRRMRERFASQVQAVAFSQWKRPIARTFFGGSALRFVEAAEPLAPGEERATWGRGDMAGPGLPGGRPEGAPRPGDRPARKPGGDSLARGHGDDTRIRHTDDTLLRVEDGFLRSVGLGANLVQPLSWVIDSRGMYYDASAASDLEALLEAGGFDSTLLSRASALREAIVAAGITKYNVGAGVWQRPQGKQRVVLVPGQVENDASITWGAPGVRTNLGLLQAVRALQPEAWIVYKPHPDVLAGKRPGHAEVEASRRWCDEIVTDVPIHRVFEQVDELQVLTSLAGFEALLRGLPVTCHGSPFYAGWGLTHDVVAHPRRTRRLSLDELVAGALIVYPTYVSRTTGAFTTPERALFELAHWDDTAPSVDQPAIRALRFLKRKRDAWRGPR
jgi:capsular polysaccharide export protein